MNVSRYWVPDDPSVFITVHPAARGVSGMAFRGPGRPQPHTFRPAFRWPLRCAVCSLEWDRHRATVRAARMELRRRRGKIPEACPRCQGTGQYVDPDGIDPFRDCPRCHGWGRVWEKRR